MLTPETLKNTLHTTGYKLGDELAPMVYTWEVGNDEEIFEFYGTDEDTDMVIQVVYVSGALDQIVSRMTDTDDDWSCFDDDDFYDLDDDDDLDVDDDDFYDEDDDYDEDDYEEFDWDDEPVSFSTIY